MADYFCSEENRTLDKFLFALPKFTTEQYWHSYSQWSKGGNGWNGLEQGGTGIMITLMWYHHIHKPGSKEWRPSIIIKALKEVALSASPDTDGVTL